MVVRAQEGYPSRRRRQRRDRVRGGDAHERALRVQKQPLQKRRQAVALNRHRALLAPRQRVDSLREVLPDVHVHGEPGEVDLHHELPHQRVLRDLVLGLGRQRSQADAGREVHRARARGVVFHGVQVLRPSPWTPLSGAPNPPSALRTRRRRPLRVAGEDPHSANPRIFALAHDARRRVRVRKKSPPRGVVLPREVTPRGKEEPQHDEIPSLILVRRSRAARSRTSRSDPMNAAHSAPRVRRPPSRS